jgi:hypothetical protein
MKKILEAFRAFFNVLAGVKEKPLTHQEERSDLSHLTLLHIMQKRGRLIDFLMEDLSTYSDEQVGAAARAVHTECAKLLKETFDIHPVSNQEEGSALSLPLDTDLSRFQLSGNVTALPLRGTLRHKGWQVGKKELNVQATSAQEVLAPAEVEV